MEQLVKVPTSQQTRWYPSSVIFKLFC